MKPALFVRLLVLVIAAVYAIMTFDAVAATASFHSNLRALDTPTFPAVCSNFSFAPPVPYGMGSAPRGITIADFNHDALLDVAVASSGSNQVDVRLGIGLGALGAVVVYTAGVGPLAVTSGDFNRDGNPDLAAANYNNGSVGSASVLLGNGTGSFGATTNFTTQNGPSSVTTADFNRDGNLDLAVANFNSANVTVLLGSGTGSFTSSGNFATSGSPQQVVTADFNGDLNPDLATANRSTNRVSVLLGSGTGSFAAATNYAVGSLPEGIVAADFNADSKVDLATANFSSNNVSVLLGSGLGGFAAAQNYSAGTTPNGITTADFNSDGKLDLAVSNLSSSVYVLPGVGDGSFAAIQPAAANDATFAIAAGDLNNDGRPDLLASTGGTNSVTVILNICTGPPNTPTPTNTATQTPTPTDTATQTPISTATPTPTPTNTATATNTPTAVATATHTNVPSSTATATPTNTATATVTNTATPLPTNTPTTPPTATATPIAVSPTVTTCANPFVDISGNTFYTAINALYCRGIISGVDTTHYGPAIVATRAQFAKIMVTAFGIASYTPARPSFSDVPPSYFAYGYIESGYHAGILNGYDAASCQAAGQSSPCYLPNRPITRAQLTKIVVIAAGFTPTTPPSGQTFTDVPPNYWAYPYIETAYAQTIVGGYPDGSFHPDNLVRRDEMAGIVYKAITSP